MVDAYNDLGALLYRLGRLDEAQAVLNHALALVHQRAGKMLARRHHHPFGRGQRPQCRQRSLIGIAPVLDQAAGDLGHATAS